MCVDYIDGMDVENAPPETIFFPEPEAKEARLTFLLLSPETPAAVLEKHGISLVHRKDGTPIIDPPDHECGVLQPPQRRHWPSWRGWRSHCNKQPPARVQPSSASLAMMMARGAFFTFEGYSLTSNGAVFSGSEAATVTLMDELVTALPQFYRISRYCPSGDDVRLPCCLRALSKDLARVSLNPFLYVNGSNPQELGDVDVKPDSTIFYDELKLFGTQLRECHLQRHRLWEPTVAHISSQKSVFTFQHIFASNYFHFISESVPRLLRLLEAGDEILSNPNTKILLSSAWMAFAAEILMAAGFGGRVLPYHPCTIYRADTLYFTVAGDGQRLPSPNEVNQLRKMIMRVPMRAEEPLELPDRYIILLDRSDAHARLMEDGKTRAIPRQLMNIAEIGEALKRELDPMGYTVKILQTASLPLAEQARWMSRAKILVGVHGAGLTNAILLAPDSAVLELIPGRHQIPNDIVYDEPLRSDCAYTMFWYLTAASRIAYYSLVLHEFSWEDPIVLSPEPVVRMVSSILALPKINQSRIDDQSNLVSTVAHEFISGTNMEPGKTANGHDEL